MTDHKPTEADLNALDITPEWRDELLGFVNNGHQVGLMRKACSCSVWLAVFTGVRCTMCFQGVNQVWPKSSWL